MVGKFGCEQNRQFINEMLDRKTGERSIEQIGLRPSSNHSHYVDLLEVSVHVDHRVYVSHAAAHLTMLSVLISIPV